MNDTIYRITLYNKAIYRYISYTTHLVAGCTPVDGKHLERMPVMKSRWCRRARRPPAGARGVLASLLFLLPPQAAKQATRVNRKALITRQGFSKVIWIS